MDNYITPAYLTSLPAWSVYPQSFETFASKCKMSVLSPANKFNYALKQKVKHIHHSEIVY